LCLYRVVEAGLSAVAYSLIVSSIPVVSVDQEEIKKSVAFRIDL